MVATAALTVVVVGWLTVTVDADGSLPQVPQVVVLADFVGSSLQLPQVVVLVEELLAADFVGSALQVSQVVAGAQQCLELLARTQTLVAIVSEPLESIFP